MTDLEIIQKCAEKMGLGPIPHLSEGYYPLHDDAQALALVKKFELRLWKEPFDYEHRWAVCRFNARGDEIFRNHDLNRAICECVARME